MVNRFDMSSSQTLELRWFFDQPVLRYDSWDSMRTDLYAPIADGRSSVKLRLESDRILLETKHWIHNIGKFERWRKLSIPVIDNPSILSDANRNWLSVIKQRRLEHYRWDDAVHQWQRAPNEDNATQVEWAQIVVRGQTHWTFALESLAQSPQSPKRHRTALQMLCNERIANSGIAAAAFKLPMSYPQWLCRFQANGFFQFPGR